MLSNFNFYYTVDDGMLASSRKIQFVDSRACRRIISFII